MYVIIERKIYNLPFLKQAYIIIVIFIIFFMFWSEILELLLF